MIKVLVVEDSPVIREFLVHLLGSDPEIQVVGTAKDGEEAIRAVEQMRPDIVTMDIHMPRMNGLDATRQIMQSHPTPIVIVSGSWDSREVVRTFHAVEAGALAIVRRPAGLGHPDHGESTAELVHTVKLMSEVKVVRRWARSQPATAVSTVSPAGEMGVGRTSAEIRLVAIGASTGGPLALQAILCGLPKDFSIPIVIVQHMATGFIQGFVEWLAQTSGFSVHVASQGEIMQPGRAYVAPDGSQMKVANGGRIWLTADEPEGHLRPSVSYLFRSVANVYGKNAIGVLLTGMGKDGAQELKLLKEMGAITFAQDEESSVVHGMPGEAIELGAASYVLSPGRIAEALSTFTPRQTG
jgi:two-component system, chemotaxis family, protein-glutamate methylesterase/glutaminase